MKRSIAAAAALVLTISMTGCSKNETVQIHGIDINKDAYSIKLDSSPVDVLDILAQMPDLRLLNLQDTALSPADYEAIRKALPKTNILWNVSLDGAAFPSDSTQLTLSSFSESTLDALRYFPKLTTVDASECLDLSQIQRLKELYPNLEVLYKVFLDGQEYSIEETSIVPAGNDIQELTLALSMLPKLEQVDLRETNISDSDASALMQQFPSITFLRNIKIAGQIVPVETEELEFSGPNIPLSEIEAAIPSCPNLKKVVLLDSGMSNEELDALNQKFPDVQIAWNMNIGLVPVRTDDKFFAPITYGFTKVWGDAEFEKLNYMTEVECVDLGHNQVHNIDWVKKMTKLKYLILADTPITDIEALAGHPSLIYLEIFSTAVNDYTPLTTCKKLEDINISRTRGDPEPLAKMTWLKNIWWGDNLAEINMTEQNRINRQKAEELLPKALPNTNVMLFIGAPTLQGWRDLPNYFAMRDCLGMFYMPGSTD